MIAVWCPDRWDWVSVYGVCIKCQKNQTCEKSIFKVREKEEGCSHA